MSLRGRMTAYLVGLHAVFLVLALLLYRERPLVIVGVELLLLGSLLVGLLLIGRALQPLDYARRFHELLQDRNYAARLQQSPHDELAGLVDLFNRMLDALYQERLKLGEQRGFLDRLLEASPSAVIAFDFDGRISLINASAAALALIRLIRPSKSNAITALGLASSSRSRKPRCSPSLRRSW